MMCMAQVTFNHQNDARVTEQDHRVGAYLSSSNAVDLQLDEVFRRFTRYSAIGPAHINFHVGLRVKCSKVNPTLSTAECACVASISCGPGRDDIPEDKKYVIYMRDRRNKAYLPFIHAFPCLEGA